MADDSTQRYHALWVGLLSGLFGGLVGLGGGVVLIPLLVGVLHIDQHRAHATSLLAVVVTGIAGALSYGSEGSMEIPAAVILAASAMISTRFGIDAARAMDSAKLKRFFGFFLLFTAALMIAKPWLTSAQPHPGDMPLTLSSVVTFLLVGSFTGFVSGMMGIGGGGVMVPALVILGGLTQHEAQGTSLLVMIPAGLVGTWKNIRHGAVATRIAPMLIPGIVIGTFGGSQIAHEFDGAVLRYFFAAVMVWTSLRYIKQQNKK